MFEILFNQLCVIFAFEKSRKRWKFSFQVSLG